MLPSDIESIIVKYLNREASIQEMKTLEVWLMDQTHLDIFKSYVKTKHLVDLNTVKFNTERSKKQLLALIADEKKVFKIRSYYRVASYAAVVVLIIGLGFLFKNDLFNQKPQETDPGVSQLPELIKIGTDKATLTLEDGTQVELSQTSPYHNAYIDSDGKELVYSQSNYQAHEIAYNTLTIPRGGQFFVHLSDGTKVWLNSESQLKYPKNFIEGKPRQVELVYGEAYFEVSPSSLHKESRFKVLSRNQTIEVLGTQFNLKAYNDDQSSYTILVEGKIVLETTMQNKILKPNEQAIVNEDQTISISEIDVYNEIAWKDGVFNFKGKPLKDIMNVLARWYDVEVVFENKTLENDLFGGSFSKEQPLTDILNLIQNTVNANFEIIEKTILIK